MNPPRQLHALDGILPVSFDAAFNYHTLSGCYTTCVTLPVGWLYSKVPMRMKSNTQHVYY